MNVQSLKVSDLLEYEFNNRIHTKEQVDLIARSIKDFGFNQPIVIDEKRVVLVGHGRLLAAKTLGLSEVPCLQVTGLSDQQKSAYRILDNKLQNDSQWDFNNLELELGSLEDNGYDLFAWGLDKLIHKELPDMEPEEQEQAEASEFLIEVSCMSLGHQQDLLTKLEADGLKCKPVTK